MAWSVQRASVSVSATRPKTKPILRAHLTALARRTLPAGERPAGSQEALAADILQARRQAER